MGTEVVKVAGIDRAVEVLAHGGLVAFPTETFYGLGALARDAAAVRRVFELKGRPWSKPLLVLVDSVAMAESVARLTEQARALMARHWPGALTVVVQARSELPTELTAGTGTIGVRQSPHTVARTLVARLGFPITAPTANPSGAAPPTTAEEVRAYFDGALDLVLDGGPSPGGSPSTIVDATGDTPRVLRQGAVQI